MKKELKQVHIIISGYVQKTLYRKFAIRRAKSLNLTGWTRNLKKDRNYFNRRWKFLFFIPFIKPLIFGRVECVVQGKQEDIDKFTEWSKKGPFSKWISKAEIEVTKEKVTKIYDNFSKYPDF
ncbi:MAG: acylphosphatase [Candidatus Levybacteria bacterium]|nr:acylphosphatase [Candidatus Levybacteria bacterium]